MSTTSNVPLMGLIPLLRALFALLLAMSFVGTAHAQVTRAITNGGFESNDPNGAGAPSFQTFTSAAVPGWDSTTNQIELWDNGMGGTPAHSGAVFAELNTSSPSTYYQNICLVNGETLRWSFAHRARIDNSQETQTASLQVANSGGTVLQTLATQVSTRTANVWTVNSNSLGVTYTGASGTQRVQLSTTDAGAFGNYVDSAAFDIVPFVEFSFTPASGSEAVPTANLPTLVVNGVVPTGGITVPVTITGGTATRGIDYTTPGGGATFNISIAAGTYSNQTFALGISVINETEREFDETIIMSIGTSSNYIISSTSTCGSAGRNSATYTITNDDTSRGAGTPPTLSCPRGTTLFDWDTRAWTAGSTNVNYTVTEIGNVNFNIVKSSGTWTNYVVYGGQAPARNNIFTGGLLPPQYGLFQQIDFPNSSAEVTTTITLATAVPGAQFKIFDVDYALAQYADRITVTGTNGGTPVTPILTNGYSNVVNANSALGDAMANDTTADGNITVTFASPVDTIVFTFGNWSGAPADPALNDIVLHDITFCTPGADIGVTKSSSVIADGISASNPKAIPGSTVRYCILVTNAAGATASNLVVGDLIPSNLTYVTGSAQSATSCSGTTTAEDDNNSGADETDPFGIEFAGTTVTGRAVSLAATNSFAMIFNAIVN